MIFGRGVSIGPVQATSAFFCVIIQSILPSNLTTTKESRRVFAAIVAEIWVLLVTYKILSCSIYVGTSLFDKEMEFQSQFGALRQQDFAAGGIMLK